MAPIVPHPKWLILWGLPTSTTIMQRGFGWGGGGGGYGGVCGGVGGGGPSFGGFLLFVVA